MNQAVLDRQLVRYRKEDGAYVLSLMYDKEPRHYKIEQHLNRLSIEGGQYFETLIEIAFKVASIMGGGVVIEVACAPNNTNCSQLFHESIQPDDSDGRSSICIGCNNMIDHYHFRQDGLLCKLRKVVAAPDFIRTKQDSVSISNESLEGGSPKSLTKNDTTMNNLRLSSHSLPSLASCPVISANPDGNVGNRDSPIPRKITEDVMHTSNDLISFNDWPNVTSLLANQNVPPDLNNNNVGVGNKFAQNNNAAGVKRIPAASPANKFARPSLPPLQSITLGCGGDGFMHTPFTPVGTEATPTPRAGNVTSSPTSPFSRARLKSTFTSASICSANLNTSSDGPQLRSIPSSATCPLIPDVFRLANSDSANDAGQRSPSITRAAQQNQISHCKFAPNNSLPPESLNFPPIIDVLWEEPDGSSEDRSQPGSSLVSIDLEALPPPPPHILNPFIKRPSPTSSQPPVNSSQSCHHAPETTTTAATVISNPEPASTAMEISIRRV
ncbi:hypothetical protein Aperf_G00000112552 [Anoplocephala perfoliata]